MTSPTHASGTDRLAEIAAAVPCGLIVNVQGDEPLLDPAVIDAAVAPLRARSVDRRWARRRGRCGTRRADQSEHGQGRLRRARVRALFFARADSARPRRVGRRRGARPHRALRLSARRRCCGSRSLPPGPLERAEALEQLRALEHGIRINVVETAYESLEVNTPGRSRARQPAERCCVERDIVVMDRHERIRETSDQIHLRHRRRRVVARQGPGGRLDRRAARRARLQGHAAEVRPLHQRRSRAR